MHEQNGSLVPGVFLEKRKARHRVREELRRDPKTPVDVGRRKAGIIQADDLTHLVVAKLCGDIGRRVDDLQVLKPIG
jgi:hypothetical protein